MNWIALFLIGSATLACWQEAASFQDLPLAEKIRFCAVVAEVHVDSVELSRDRVLKMDELICRCTIFRVFKAPFTTNSVTLRFLYMNTNLTYEGKMFLVFAFDHKSGYRPYGGQGGLVEKGHPCYDLVPGSTKEEPSLYRKIDYDALIDRIRVVTSGR